MDLDWRKTCSEERGEWEHVGRTRSQNRDRSGKGKLENIILLRHILLNELFCL